MVELFVLMSSGCPLRKSEENAKIRLCFSFSFLIGQRGYLKRQHPNVTRATMGPMALCQRTLAGDAIGTQFLRDSPDGAFPVSIPYCDGKQEERERPVVSTRFSLGVENDRADAGRDGCTRLARPNLKARTGTGKIHFFPVQLTTSGIEDPSAECDDQ